MDRYCVRRAGIALIAAYALALQTLLAGFISLSPAEAAAASALPCIGDPATPADDVSDHRCVAVCAAMGHGLSGADTAMAVAAVWAAKPASGVTIRHEPLAAVRALSGGASPRGPPPV
jgi:hypothetical protein